MEILINNEKIKDELQLLLNMFYSETEQESLNYTFNVTYSLNNNLLNVNVNCNQFKNEECYSYNLSNIEMQNSSKYVKRHVKIAFYNFLHTITNVTLPYGSLTGIRPTKLFYEIKENLNSSILAKNELINKYKVTKDKAELIMEITKHQNSIIKNDKLVDLYVNIPFCTSRCYYCSFLAANINMCQMLVEPYIEALIKDIKATKKFLSKNNYIVKSVYIGGGTPTSLSAEQLNRILNELNYFDIEFTVEAGRPDTITKEKLDVLKAHNVTRISINPQTFNNKTLKEIGRNHTTKDILEAYKLALPYNFKINMDLIAGLNGETFANFKNSINKTLEFSPNNITVHTLSVKRGSNLKDNGGKVSNALEVSKMVEFATKKLMENGYYPYYMYKQKNMIGNLENIGYSKPNDECVFNIDSMEEVASIVACGAGAISKRYYSYNNRIERFANVKNIQEYVSRIDEMIEKKNNLFS